MQTQIAKKTRYARSGAATALAVGACLAALTVCAPRPVHAQDPAGGAVTKKVSLNLVNQPVQTALRLLFTSVGLNNSIDQDVQGLVTINLTDVSFETALRSLLNAANPPLAYDVQGGVYHISVKRDQPFVPTQPIQQPTTNVAEGVHLYRIPLDHIDPVTMASILQRSSQKGVIVVPVSGSNGNGTGNGNGNGNNGFGGGGLGGNTGFGGGLGGGIGGIGGGPVAAGGGGGGGGRGGFSGF